MTARHDGARWRQVRNALGLSQREMAERLNSLDPEGLRIAASSISRYESGHHLPAPHIQGAYQAVALLGNVPIPEQTGPRPNIAKVIGLIEAEAIVGYCANVIDGTETAAPDVETARAILALARFSYATLERET